MAGPTLVADYDSPDWGDSATPKTVGVTASDGDLLVAVAATENANISVGAPTGGSGITWSLVDQIGTGGGDGYCVAYSAEPTAQAYTHSMSRTGTGEWGFCVARLADSDGIGAIAKTAGAGSTPSLNITTTQDNSGILVIDSDWNAVNGSSPTFRQVNGASPVHLANGGTAGSIWWGNAYYYADAGPAGIKTVGETSPTGQDPAMIAIEILGTAASGPPEGTATEQINLTDTASGSILTEGSATDQIDFSDSASGERESFGSAVDTVSFADSAMGTAPGVGPNLGTAIETLSFSDVANGERMSSGSASDQLDILDSASGVMVSAGSASETVTLSDSADGEFVPQGSATETIQFSDSATGPSTGKPVYLGDQQVQGVYIGDVQVLHRYKGEVQLW